MTLDGRVFREPGKKNDSFSKRANSDGLIEVGQSERGGNAKDGRYMSVNITLKDESGNALKQIKYYTHRLVAESLLDNPSNAETVNHIDENGFLRFYPLGGFDPKTLTAQRVIV